LSFFKAVIWSGCLEASEKQRTALQNKTPKLHVNHCICRAVVLCEIKSSSMRVQKHMRCHFRRKLVFISNCWIQSLHYPFHAPSQMKSRASTM
jgi:hypothetical protein